MMSYKQESGRVLRSGAHVWIGDSWERLSIPELYDHEWITPVLCRQTFPKKYNVLIKPTKRGAKTK